MPFETTIDAFAAALTDPAAPPPAVTHGRLGAPDARRFSVYRNNVAVGLIGALEARYPVSRRILGADLFRAIAQAFAIHHPPRSPVMIAYGADFPDFIEAYKEARDPAAGDLANVADVARLESAWVEAYHAEDAPAVTVNDLGKLSAAALPRTRVEFHPAAFLLRFATPAASIWAAHQRGAHASAPTSRLGEDALIARPGPDVSVRVLPPGGYEFAARLRGGATLVEAAESMRLRDFDFGTHLVGLVEAGALASIIAGEPA